MLARLFTPLFTALLLGFLVTFGWTSANLGAGERFQVAGINVEREALILFDLLLAVVLGLLLYSISARDPLAPPSLFDKLQFALVVSALVVDVLVLLEITGRITEYGHHTQQGGGARGECHPAGQSHLVGVAGTGFRPPAHTVRGARALADRLPAGIRRVGLDRGAGLPPVVQLPLISRLTCHTPLGY